MELNRTQIARVIFAAAESMGISDRNRIEWLTNQVIERLERPQTLPGMENLVPRNYKQKRVATEFEILTMVKEFLAGGELAQEERIQPQKEELAVPVKIKARTTTGVNLTLFILLQVPSLQNPERILGKIDTGSSLGFRLNRHGYFLLSGLNPFLLCQLLTSQEFFHHSQDFKLGGYPLLLIIPGH